MTTQQIDRGTMAVESVNDRGAMVRIDRQPAVLVDWDTLRQAARQDDPALRAAYAGLLASAEEMALRTGRLTVRVERCQSNVGHRVAVRDVSGRDVTSHFRRADEGGDHHGGGQFEDGRRFAEAEAEGIRARLHNRLA